MARRHPGGLSRFRPISKGLKIQVAFANKTLAMTVGRTYTDVPSGMPVAVLHREGLTFAIHDGNFSAAYDVAVGARFSISAVACKQ